MLVPSLSERLIAALRRLTGRREPDSVALPSPAVALRLFSRDADTSVSAYWPGWKTLQARDLDALTTHPDATLLLGLASTHFNGFVRQYAVTLLDTHGDEDALPFLLDRLNDWAWQVRAVARRAVLRRLTPAMAPTFRDCLPRIGQLQRQHRDDHAPLITAIRDLLSRPECRPVLDAGRSHPETPVREECYRLLWALPDQDHATLLLSAIADREPRIRLWAARTARAEVDAGTLLRLWNATAREPMPGVRVSLLYGLAERFPESAAPALESVLLDRSAALRGMAQFYLPRLQSGIDLAGRYRDALSESDSEPRRVAAALLGLAETGGREDASYALAFVRHPAPAVRRAAFEMIARLQGAGAVSTLLTALGDASPSVAKEGQNALLPYAGNADVEAEAARLLRDDASPLHTRRIALTLLAEGNKWRGLGYLLEAVGDADSALAEVAGQLLERWLARAKLRSVTLDPALRTELEDLLDRAPLEDTTVRTIRHLLHW